MTQTKQQRKLKILKEYHKIKRRCEKISDKALEEYHKKLDKINVEPNKECEDK